MSSYLQIAGDPTKWWLAQAIQPSQLTGQALSVEVEAPLAGTLLLSTKSASAAVVSEGAAAHNLVISYPVIYLPTAAGPTAGFAGFELPASADLATLASQITTLMSAGGHQVIALGGSGGTLVLNGAALSFVVLCPGPPPVMAGGVGPVAGGSMPHDASHT
jgi:hypothetical protein